MAEPPDTCCWQGRFSDGLLLKQPYCSCTLPSLPWISGAVTSGTVWGFSNKKRIGFFSWPLNLGQLSHFCQSFTAYPCAFHLQDLLFLFPICLVLLVCDLKREILSSLYWHWKKGNRCACSVYYLVCTWLGGGKYYGIDVKHYILVEIIMS